MESVRKMSEVSLIGLVVLIVFPALVIYDGFILKTIWNWFIPEIFGITPLTIPQAIGLSLVIAYFKPSKSSDKDDDENPIVTHLIYPIAQGLFILFLAWITFQFM